MSSIEIFFLAVALAMDCFAVSIVSGVILQRMMWRTMLMMAFLFGLFQAMMPLIGWAGMSFFSEAVAVYDHWIAFALLAYVGGRMVIEGWKGEESQSFRPERLRTQIILAISTSIDALAVGISFACLGYHEPTSLTFPLFMIGVVSFVFSLVGNGLGVCFGQLIARRMKPELVGGLILLFIGVKLLVTHLLE